MNNLLTGYLITIVALSLSEGVSGIIGAAADNVKASINLSTARKQVEINKLAMLADKMENDSSRVVGFTIPTEEDDEEYEDDE